MRRTGRVETQNPGCFSLSRLNMLLQVKQNDKAIGAVWQVISPRNYVERVTTQQYHNKHP